MYLYLHLKIVYILVDSHAYGQVSSFMEKELGCCCLVCKEVSALILFVLYWVITLAMTAIHLCCSPMVSVLCTHMQKHCKCYHRTQNFTPPHPSYKVPCKWGIFVNTLGSFCEIIFLPFYSLRYGKKNQSFSKYRINEYIAIIMAFVLWLS